MISTMSEFDKMYYDKCHGHDGLGWVRAHPRWGWGARTSQPRQFSAENEGYRVPENFPGREIPQPLDEIQFTDLPKLPVYGPFQHT